METLGWILALLLMALGLCGAVFPVMPDSLFILAGAAVHHFMEPPARTVGWRTLWLLAALCVLAHVADFAAGAIGARKYGASRWGAVGGLAGGLVGLFFFPVGLFLGPVIGVLAAEILLARKDLIPAARSSWGTLLGTIAGMVCKLAIDVSMVAIFLYAALSR